MVRQFLLPALVAITTGLLVGCTEAVPPTGLLPCRRRFDQLALNASWVSLVDVSMPNCQACENGAVVAQLADELAGTVMVGTIDLFDDGRIGMRYNIDVVPTFLVADGKLLSNSPVSFLPMT